MYYILDGFEFVEYPQKYLYYEVQGIIQKIINQKHRHI